MAAKPSSGQMVRIYPRRHTLRQPDQRPLLDGGQHAELFAFRVLELLRRHETTITLNPRVKIAVSQEERFR